MTIHFLAGLPRTGSTLLGSILSQNPLIHVTPTSPLYAMLVGANELLNRLDLQYTFDKDFVGDAVYSSMVESVHRHVNRPYIFDKFRGWPQHVEAIQRYINPNPKIVATVRPIAEVITSYLKLAKADPKNFIDEHLRRNGEDVNNESRANLLWSFYIKPIHDNLCIGLKTHPANILLIEYDDIVFSPVETINAIYQFCEIPSSGHCLTEIHNYCAEEKDEAWRLKGLHDIRSSLDRQSDDPTDYLPLAAVEFFAQFDFRSYQCRAHT